MNLELTPTTAGVMSRCDCPTHEDGEKASEWVENAEEDRFSAEAAAFARFAPVLASPRLVAGSLVVVVAVPAVFGPTRNVIAPASNELGALALFTSTVSVLDGFLGIMDAVFFDMFTPRPLLFAARSLFGGFRSHGNLLGRDCRGIVEDQGSAIVVSHCPV